MKKTWSVLLLLLSFQITQAQNTFNGDFESWLGDTSYNPSSWLAVGSVTQSDDTKEGTYALRLDNDFKSQRFSTVSTGPFINGKLGAIPYSEQPLSLRFSTKYNLGLGDKAQITAAFSIKGNIIGYANFYIEGNSNDSFVDFSVPIVWQVSTQPDSVAIIISSIDLENNEINGDGYIIFDDVHFATISTRNMEIPNGNFNLWDSNTEESLNGWISLDEYLSQVTGIKPSPAHVRKTSNKRSGNYALEFQSSIVARDTLVGMAITGSSFETTQKPAFAVNQKWKYLEGYAQYTPSNGDSAMISLSLFKNGVPIGYGLTRLSETTTSFTYFAMNINYQVNVVPDSATLYISCANPSKPRGANSKLVVDDLKFTDQNLSVYDLNFNKLTVYPNPFKDQFNISGIDRLEGATYELRDLNGRLFRSGEVLKNMTIDVRDAESGIYLLHFEGRYINVDKILLKE